MSALQAIGDVLGRSFLSPVLFAFLGLIPIVILLYLLKLRRTEMLISSTILWMKSLQDLTANAPFQRLRKNLLLLLQILILLLVVTALARPFKRAEGLSGNNICLLIDRSGSMRAREGDTTRLELAKQKALEMVDDMRGGDKMMIVTFADSSDVRCELTSDRFRLREAVNSISPSDTATKIRDAIFVVRSLQAPRGEGETVVADLRVVVLSDGQISDLKEVGAHILNVSFVQVGESSNNAGIAAFSVREPLEGRGDRQSFVLVHNEHTEPLETTLTLTFNDTVLMVEELNIPPGEDREVVVAHPELGSGLLRAQLDHDDDLAVDNAAWLALRPAASVKVLLVADSDSAGAYFLKRAFALDSRVELSAIDPANYAETDEYDLTIFDGSAPRELPAGSLIFINSLPPLPDIKSEGTIETAPVLAWDSEHPVLRFLNPANIGIRKAQRLALPDGSRTLISTTGGPLMADVSRGGQQILVIAFDIAESNWPLRLSFPLFIQNVLAWVPRGTFAAETSVATGRPLTIMPAPDIEYATVTLPDGSVERVQLDPLRPVYFGSTEVAGPYVVTQGDTSEQYAVNMLDRNESAITPAEALTIGRAEVKAERGRVKQNRELWRFFVMAALVVLMVEWSVYSRRAWI
jgi:hypothetical protein